MNLRLTLKLLTVPTLMSSVVAFGILAQPASAADSSSLATALISQSTCDSPSVRELKLSTTRHRNITIASAGLGSDRAAILDFSEAESDAAVVLFGCDCPACINALRQLQSQSLLNGGGSGHCWAALQRRVSPQQIQEVLQNLDMRESE